MKSAWTVAVPFLLVLGAGRPQDGLEILRRSETSFRPYRGEALEQGDLLRTSTEPAVLSFVDGTTLTILQDSEVAYDSSRSVALNFGEVEAERKIAGDKFKIILDVFAVHLAGGAVRVAIHKGEILIDSLPPDLVSVDVEAFRTGFHLFLEEKQAVSLFYDAETQATRVVAAGESSQPVTVRIEENPISVLVGDITLQEIFVAPDVLKIPSGCQVLIRRSARVREREAAAPPPETLPVPGEELEPPRDEPFEDSGDVLEVANVSPSQP